MTTTYTARLLDTGAQTAERPWAVYAAANGREWLDGAFATEAEAAAEASRRTKAATAPKYRTITLTDRAPVKIREEDWPEIASARDWDNQHESQANRRWSLRVRQNRHDGRTIVYGTYTTQFQGERALAAGELITPPSSMIDAIRRDEDGETLDWCIWDEIPAAIKRVAANCGCDRIADECIADLPAEEI